MTDLIKRNDLYNKIVELEKLARNRVLDTPTNSPCYQRYVSQLDERTAFKELVADMSTAYDVEKVVSELKKAIERNVDIEDENGNSWNDDIISADKAIEIIRKGGAE